MIKAYLAWITSGYEGEDVEVRYSIYRDEELIKRETLFIDYKKPALAGQFALKILLSELEDYIDEDITIVINDGALNEIIRGTSTSKNRELQNMGQEKFKRLEVENVSGNHIEMTKWDNILKF